VGIFSENAISGPVGNPMVRPAREAPEKPGWQGISAFFITIALCEETVA
jgi:hypothetical protein